MDDFLEAKENNKNRETTETTNTDSTDKVHNETLEDMKCKEESTECKEACTEEASISESEKLKAEYEEKLAKMAEENKTYLDHLQRLAAEFDNYKKRTTKEKERLYQDAVCDTVSKLLPVVDNFERALAAIDTADEKSFREGVIMVAKQLDSVLANIGVEKIQALGCKFDPNVHNAVMHTQDDNVEENTIVEELQSGYKYKDQVIRHSMVKVAN
ncbi:MAG: nucleotide exchange factor GrpE [Clostridia bacterium]|jgi:molecular chaperone GrpE|nr:nucleotide exchange factor GrpE [Clostridiaceae bacterium]